MGLFRFKPKAPKRLSDYLNIEFKEELNKPKPDYKTGLAKYLNINIDYQPKSANRSLFYLAINKVL